MYKQTMITWYQPTSVPDRDSVLLISMKGHTGQIDPGYWDNEKSIFSAWQKENGQSLTIAEEEIQCWAFWPDPPDFVLSFPYDLDLFRKPADNNGNVYG